MSTDHNKHHQQQFLVHPELCGKKIRIMRTFFENYAHKKWNYVHKYLQIVPTLWH